MDKRSHVDPSMPPIGAASPGAPASQVRILRRRDIAALMRPRDYLVAAEAAFRALALGAADMPLPMHVDSPHGTLHAKGARVALDGGDCIALKANANFPGNRADGLPTIQGAILLFDGRDGALVAIMDSIEITAQRTAAASVLAARFLAPARAGGIAILGCGEQARAQVAAFADAVPPTRVRVFDVERERARAFARQMREALGLDVAAVDDPRDATKTSDIVVTVTPARTPILSRDMVRGGTFIAAVGADSPDKNEIASDLFAAATIVVDSRAQCAVMGDLHHALAAGAVDLGDVHAELGDLVMGRKPGRSRRDEITLFDSTGIGVLDAVAAVHVNRRARETGIGSTVALGSN